MAEPDAMILLTAWSNERAAPPHYRLARLLVALGEDSDKLARETLGERNRRLLELHEAWVGGEIEARVACQACATANSFIVPKAAMLALAAPAVGAVAEIMDGATTLRFRLPTMADIAAVAGSGDADAIRSAMLRRCAVGGTTFAVASLDAATMAHIEAAFDELDPLASIIVESACSDCRTAIAATIDLAMFVATDVDRMAAALLRDIDCIASAYGWSEAAIAGLPLARRAQYVAMIGARRLSGGRSQPARMQLS